MIKNLTPVEKSIVAKLAGMDTHSVHTVQDFLESFYFMDSTGRALILQNIDQYAVFYLRNDLFNVETTKNKEILDYFELIRFMHNLMDEGYITIYGNDYRKMYLVQDDFKGEKIEKNIITLNTKGYYTDSPKFIYDKNQHAIYQGIILKYQAYEQIRNLISGNIIVSSKLITYYQEVLKPEEDQNTAIKNNSTNMQTNEKTQSRWGVKNYLLVSATVLAVLLLVFASYYTSLKVFSQDTSQYLPYSPSSKVKTVDQKCSTIPREITPIISETSIEKYYYGIDISHYNGSEVSHITNIDSLSFVICKATEGTYFTDPYFHVNWDILKSKNYLVGAYHFFLVHVDPIKQADFYIQTVNMKGNTDLAPIVDIEDASIPQNSNFEPEEIQRRLLIFLDRVKSQTNRDPIIYTGSYFANRYLMNDSLGNYRLWLAEYTTHTPRLPKIWKKKGYFIWQKSDDYMIDAHYTDFDQYYGSMDQLVQ
jgi:GH25 family lysozyme M1 (1,4-beta-N-acetylmuramidase)